MGNGRLFGSKLRNGMIGSKLGCDSHTMEYLVVEEHAWILSVKIY